MSTKTVPSAQLHEPVQPSKQKLSPLLNLPGELHNQIYDYIFTEPAYTFRLGLNAERDYVLRPLFQTPGWIGLTAACRQIHTEAVLLPFENVIFQVGAGIQLMLLLDRFKELPQSETIFRLEIRTQDVSCMTIAEAMTYNVPIVQIVEVKMVIKSRARKCYLTVGWGDLLKFPEAGGCDDPLSDHQERIHLVFLKPRGI
ncbi:hypothetical protein HBI56_127010 [Parastagonospora nodorum]|uniref:F-box domain-containing protein n=1 Tax=Phaeosphaeria nodorum (strain SN15 / ATCC MYA-4574 / FGSC 10173) TaxID=321614 RepID=A0A7U2F565_PHANO|nr:hypothetical protein HBH56_168370 [Parastagonospora nodorum]QRC98691.1 hypothetical protein JI435_047330 [Parastagonospora nodorum SN15]KAH3936408.1 hypothetical protein HBH54_031460 [Parastagonospora nodorum]KAH3948356.1 hypothetical protein HBH53_106230 [Parastagonospora nodorum]KAH3968844.1 hypothetical protein HBH51_130150 [Parastagonospora nodorum]